jgi:hypothetical protein
VRLQKIRFFTARRQKKRRPADSQAPPYNSISLYRTSLDHLLLGMVADIDKKSITCILKPFVQISKCDFRSPK